jgi:hypothetical protein
MLGFSNMPSKMTLVQARIPQKPPSMNIRRMYIVVVLDGAHHICGIMVSVL